MSRSVDRLENSVRILEVHWIWIVDFDVPCSSFTTGRISRGNRVAEKARFLPGICGRRCIRKNQREFRSPSKKFVFGSGNRSTASESTSTGITSGTTGNLISSTPGSCWR